MNIHIFFAILTFLALILGAFLHSWVVASNTVDSKLNGITGYDDYIKRFLPVIMFRFVVSWVVYLIWADNSSAIGVLLSTHFSSLAWMQAHPIQSSPTIALAYGLFTDSLLNPLVTLLGKWIPGLKVDIPPPPGGFIEKTGY